MLEIIQFTVIRPNLDEVVSEMCLKKYLLLCRQVMEMAYAIAVEREKQGVLKVPSSWSKHEAAGED